MMSSVVSQDFKPANCMLCTDGLIKIADFGAWMNRGMHICVFRLVE